MTRLRDDGYLEIGAEPRDDSDVIVAACFVECDDYATYSIHAVGDFGWIEGELYTERNYPLLIPAKTVAEVFKEDGIRWVALVSALSEERGAVLTFDWEIPLHWLRKHTGEGEEIDRE